MAISIAKIVTEAIARGGKGFVREAVNGLLSEGIEPGTVVAVVADPISGHEGLKGTVRSVSSNNPGFVEVELQNGTKLQMQSSLLVPVNA